MLLRCFQRVSGTCLAIESATSNSHLGPQISEGHKKSQTYKIVGRKPGAFTLMIIKMQLTQPSEKPQPTTRQMVDRTFPVVGRGFPVVGPSFRWSVESFPVVGRSVTIHTKIQSTLYQRLKRGYSSTHH